jgi:hypothetical protein
MKHVTRLTLVLVLLVLTFGVASAAFTGPFYDTYVIIGSTNTPTAPQVIVADSTASCTDTWIAYFQFDASAIGTASSASLVLTHGNTLVGLGSNPTLTLYGTADFDQATLNGTNNPPTGGATVIQSQPIPSGTVAGTKLTWGGSDPGLRNYIQTQANTDNVVTLALSFSANCDQVNSQVNFYSSEYNTTPANRPQLTVEGTTPTAVDMSSASAQQTSWPFYVGLGAVALVVVAGLAISRRRTA